jgi:hypothetical protein
MACSSATQRRPNFVPVNMADHWLRLVLAVGMIGLGVLLGRDRHALR